MARLSLKNIIGKKNDSYSLLVSIIGQLKADIFIEDEKGNLLYGSTGTTHSNQEPVILDNELMGWVKGDENVITIAQLLTYLAQKEAEKKKLGSEVLNLYQEVNLMFDFSDKLAQTIGAQHISQITLEEASHVIKSDNGVIVLWDEESKQLQVMATMGESFFDREKINSELTVLLKIILSGQSEIISDVSTLTESGIILPHIKSVIYSALKVKHRVMGAIIIASNDPVQYTAADLKLLTTLALQSSAAIESALLYQKNIREANEREQAMRRVYAVTGKFVPFEFIKSLGHELITDVKLGDQVEKAVTILFTDIRDYTSLSEQMTPEENFAFICSFNEKMGPVIHAYNGFINQYQGDAIMAIFPNSAANALTAAVEMQKTVEKFNKARMYRNRATIKMGIGLHTGPLIMGITGDNERMAPTTISDAVNTASRIESLTKYYKASIILTDATIQQIPNQEDFYLRCLGKVQVKGKQAPVGIHECFSGNSEEEIAKKEKTLPAFNKGMTDYLNKSFSDAIDSFNKVIRFHPEDRTTEFFIEKATRYIKNGVPENWAGVEEMLNK